MTAPSCGRLGASTRIGCRRPSLTGLHCERSTQHKENGLAGKKKDKKDKKGK